MKVTLNENLRAQNKMMLAALEAVVGHGYCENTSPVASQDWVSKQAIAQVRKVIAKIKE